MLLLVIDKLTVLALTIRRVLLLCGGLAPAAQEQGALLAAPAALGATSRTPHSRRAYPRTTNTLRSGA